VVDERAKKCYTGKEVVNQGGCFLQEDIRFLFPRKYAEESAILLGKEKRFFKNKKFTCRRQAKNLLKTRQIPLPSPFEREVREAVPIP